MWHENLCFPFYILGVLNTSHRRLIRSFVFVSNMSVCLNISSNTTMFLLFIFTRLHMFANTWDWIPSWLRLIHVAKLALQEQDEMITWMNFMTNALRRRRNCNHMCAIFSFSVFLEHSLAPIWVKLSSKCPPERLTILETGAHSLVAKSQTCPQALSGGVFSQRFGQPPYLGTKPAANGLPGPLLS